MTTPCAELLSLVVLLAESDPLDVPAEPWQALCAAVNDGALEALSPEERWSLLAGGLLCKEPRHFLQILRLAGALARLLPEFDALFGVPELSDAADAVDVGEHQERVLLEASKVRAPLAVRFAALVQKLGKAGTPKEIWPSHYKHEERGHAALAKVAERIRIPADALGLAQLAIAECDRVHRASDMRAGAITILLERVRAFEEPERFQQLLLVCTCDYAAYAGHSAAEYPKAERLRRAAAACRGVAGDVLDPQARLELRAAAVAAALNSSKWTDDRVARVE